MLIPCCTGVRYDYELQRKDYRVAVEGEDNKMREEGEEGGGKRG